MHVYLICSTADRGLKLPRWIAICTVNTCSNLEVRPLFLLFNGVETCPAASMRLLLVGAIGSVDLMWVHRYPVIYAACVNVGYRVCPPHESDGLCRCFVRRGTEAALIFPDSPAAVRWPCRLQSFPSGARMGSTSSVLPEWRTDGQHQFGGIGSVRWQTAVVGRRYADQLHASRRPSTHDKLSRTSDASARASLE